MKKLCTNKTPAIPGNPFATGKLGLFPIANAVLALAFEQHQRNRLAAWTAKNRKYDSSLPQDIIDLANEGLE